MRVVFDGHRAFDQTCKLLHSAQDRIWVCMYMIRRDERSKQIWRILQEKHEEGVDVRVWYDWLGSLRSVPWLAREEFTRVYLPRWTRLGARNHAKVVLVDDATAIVSGRNWTRKYYDEWVDTSVVLEEQENVEQVIEFAKLVEQKKFDPIKADSLLRTTDALSRKRGIYNFVLEHIVKAQNEIHILSPYFVIDDAIEELLKAAMERGVKVTVIVPKKPEHRLAATFNRINFQRIHHDNLTVRRSAGMFHSKVMLFDDVALVGSANFDNRSFKWNTECSVILGNNHFATIKRHLSEVADHSVKYNWIQRTYDQVLYHFTRHVMDLL